ncbi:MAG: GNAT family N-acetyltransferase [Gammaproteobacteria bacterium]|nr:GNAT family N-acetyltransferase [Gammaproteobacteria bacterium]
MWRRCCSAVRPTGGGCSWRRAPPASSASSACWPGFRRRRLTSTVGRTRPSANCSWTRHGEEGIARRLLARAETHAVELGAERLRVQVLAANTPARRLYGDFGFRDRLVELEKPLPDRDAD